MGSSVHAERRHYFILVRFGNAGQELRVISLGVCASHLSRAYVDSVVSITAVVPDSHLFKLLALYLTGSYI
jgi:hypothetical protein